MSEKAVGRVRDQQLDEECHVTGEVRQVRARARRYDERQVRDGMAPTRRPQPRPKASARRGRAQSVAISRNQLTVNWSSVAIKWPSSGHQVVIKWSSSGHQWQSSGHQVQSGTSSAHPSWHASGGAARIASSAVGSCDPSHAPPLAHDDAEWAPSWAPRVSSTAAPSAGAHGGAPPPCSLGCGEIGVVQLRFVKRGGAPSGAAERTISSISISPASRSGERST